MIEVKCAHAAMVPLADLRPNPRNPNRHPREQIELLARIVEFQGWRSPIVASRRSGLIVRGHGRWEAARLLNCETVPVDFQDYASEAEEWQDLLADNRIAELSEIDGDILREILKDIPMDATLAGYDQAFVDELMAESDATSLERDIVSEEERREASETADELARALAEKICLAADEDPRRMTKAIAVIVQLGRGSRVLVLADPDAKDFVAELTRYADGSIAVPSILEAVMEDLAP